MAVVVVKQLVPARGLAVVHLPEIWRDARHHEARGRLSREGCALRGRYVGCLSASLQSREHPCSTLSSCHTMSVRSMLGGIWSLVASRSMSMAQRAFAR